MVLSLAGAALGVQVGDKPARRRGFDTARLVSGLRFADCEEENLMGIVSQSKSSAGAQRSDGAQRVRLIAGRHVSIGRQAISGGACR